MIIIQKKKSQWLFPLARKTYWLSATSDFATLQSWTFWRPVLKKISPISTKLKAEYSNIIRIKLYKKGNEIEIVDYKNKIRMEYEETYGRNLKGIYGINWECCHSFSTFFPFPSYFTPSFFHKSYLLQRLSPIPFKFPS